MLKLFKKVFFITFFATNLLYLKTKEVKATIVPDAPENIGEPGGSDYQSGSYDLDDLVSIFINVSQFILGIVGSLALIMFVYGGFTLLLSGGNKEWVEKGNQAIKNAVIGLFIVFLSFMIIGMVFAFTDASSDGAWARVGWFD